LTVRMVVVLKAVKGVVVSVAVNRAYSWTWGVAAVKVATVAHTEMGRCRADKQKCCRSVISCKTSTDFAM